MAIANLGLLGTGSATTAGTTLTVTNTTGAPIAANTLIHITGAWDNINTATAPVITCSTVGGGTAIANHSPARGSGVSTTAGSGIWHQCWRVLTSAEIGTGATIATLTSDQSAVKRAAHARGFTEVTTTLRGSVVTGTSSSGVAFATLSPVGQVAGDVLIGSISAESDALPPTPDADTTQGTWSSQVGVFTTGGAVNTNTASSSQSKITTGVSGQTFDPEYTAGDTVACLYALVPGTAVVPAGKAKVWTGSAFVAKPAKVWTGSAWVEKPVKVWTGSAWKTLT